MKKVFKKPTIEIVGMAPVMLNTDSKGNMYDNPNQDGDTTSPGDRAKQGNVSTISGFNWK